MIDYMSKFKLDGKVAVVVGGLGLIGREVSIALGQAGAKILILDNNARKGETLKKELLQKKLNVDYIFFDISDIINLDEKIAGIFKKEGPIHIWINASYPRTKDWGTKIEDIKADYWQKNVDMHMNSYCLSTRSICELMRKEGIKGAIINYGSTYGVVGPDFEIYTGTEMKNDCTYSAIKGGIINFSRYAASFYGRFDIRVNCLCPGGIFDNQNEIFVENYEKRTPLRRMGKPEDIAAATLFLSSNAASYISGATFMVDGGWTCI